MERIPIGRPISNTQVYILDGLGEPVPVGVVGELYIGGAGVARGYLGRAELTAERFLQDPFSEEAGARMYRTGDLGRWLPDGNIEFLGRNDFQVKIRGFRVELGEIEARLLEHPGVRQAVVIAREDVPGDKRLVAYYTSSPEHTAGAEHLRSHLMAVLPDYMVPAAYVHLDSLPLTPNGKLDRGALPAPDQDAYVTQGYEPPQGETETILAQIWAEVLRVERVGRKDNFFELGGDSIRAIVASARAALIGIDLSVDQIFREQTIEKIANALLDGCGKDFSTTPEGDLSSMERGIKTSETGVALYKLTQLQVGMIFHNQLSPNAGVYHDVFSHLLRIRSWDLDRFQNAVNSLVAKHAILRTSFSFEDAEPLQCVHPKASIPVAYSDIRNADMETQDRSIRHFLQKERMVQFELTLPPLIRMFVHRRGEDLFQYTLSFHHAILDGWSVASFQTELFKEYCVPTGTYCEHSDGNTLALPLWSAVIREEAARSSALVKEFWSHYLDGHRITRVPRARAGHTSICTSDYELRIEPRVKQKLVSIASALQVSLRTVLLAAHLKVISLFSGTDDVVTGIVTHTRPEEINSERVLGLFLNTLPLRQRIERQTWSDLIRNTFQNELSIWPNRYYPYAQIYADNGRSPLFEVVFNYTNFHVYDELDTVEDIEVLQSIGYEANSFPLTVNVSSRHDGLKLRISFSSELFEPQQIERMAAYFVAALNAITADPNAQHTSAALMPSAERDRVLYEWNDTKTDFPSDKCVHQLFEEQVEQNPDATAVVFEEDALSYGELNRRANRLAHYLRQLGVRPDDRVALCVERSLEMIVALLAVLKAGGAYVPLDPAYPPDRLRFMLADSQPVALLTQTHLRSLLDTAPQIPVLDLTDNSAPWNSLSDLNPDTDSVALQPNHLAYVIYTSGSTGTPKGVMVEHRNLSN